MKRTAFLIGLAISFAIPPLAHAEVINKIEISNNGSNSTNRVEVTSDTSTSNDSSSDCHTEVHMETNGEKKDYVSDDCKEVSMESSNGNNSVHISNSTDSNEENNDTTISSTPTPTPSSGGSKTPTPTENNEKSDEKPTILKLVLDFGKKCLDILF